MLSTVDYRVHIIHRFCCECVVRNNIIMYYTRLVRVLLFEFG